MLFCVAARAHQEALVHGNAERLEQLAVALGRQYARPRAREIRQLCHGWQLRELSVGFGASGLSVWVARQLLNIEGATLGMLVPVAVLIACGMSNIVSNVATASTCHAARPRPVARGSRR